MFLAHNFSLGNVFPQLPWTPQAGAALIQPVYPLQHLLQCWMGFKVLRQNRIEPGDRSPPQPWKGEMLSGSGNESPVSTMNTQNSRASVRRGWNLFCLLGTIAWRLLGWHFPNSFQMSHSSIQHSLFLTSFHSRTSKTFLCFKKTPLPPSLRIFCFQEGGARGQLPRVLLAKTEWLIPSHGHMRVTCPGAAQSCRHRGELWLSRQDAGNPSAFSNFHLINSSFNFSSDSLKNTGET